MSGAADAKLGPTVESDVVKAGRSSPERGGPIGMEEEGKDKGTDD